LEKAHRIGRARRYLIECPVESFILIRLKSEISKLGLQCVAKELAAAKQVFGGNLVILRGPVALIVSEIALVGVREIVHAPEHLIVYFGKIFLGGELIVQVASIVSATAIPAVVSASRIRILLFVFSVIVFVVTIVVVSGIVVVLFVV